LLTDQQPAGICDEPSLPGEISRTSKRNCTRILMTAEQELTRVSQLPGTRWLLSGDVGATDVDVTRS